jgi:DNA sulfur modification protein DndB
MSAAESKREIRIVGVVGHSSFPRVFLGFAPARILHRISFADVLNEDSGTGYQRKFNPQHSLDFRNYIQQQGSSTIPLTFNLRPENRQHWRLETKSTHSVLVIASPSRKLLAQVDCQHRLGHLNDLDVELPFMCYLELSAREEMEVFKVINSKAKGLSTSLLDFHEAMLLVGDLASERPELFIALQLNGNSDSPWHRQLDLGGNSTSGLQRRASLRTMQTAVRRFLSQTKVLQSHSCETVTRMILDFWCAVSVVFKPAWDNPRRSLITKGVGVYSLMGVAGDLYQDCPDRNPDKQYFTNKLSEFSAGIDFSSTGMFKGLGGESGVKSALAILRSQRAQSKLRIVNAK